MKQKYRKFTAKYCKDLSMIHEFSSSVRMYIFEYHYNFIMRKKCADSKHLYHFKKNLYLDSYIDVRRGRRILANARMFEEFFNDQCDLLAKRIEYEIRLKATLKKVEIDPQKELYKMSLNKTLENLIGEVKCLPV